jgi:hypothetical protein
MKKEWIYSPKIGCFATTRMLRQGKGLDGDAMRCWLIFKTFTNPIRTSPG